MRENKSKDMRYREMATENEIVKAGGQKKNKKGSKGGKMEWG